MTILDKKTRRDVIPRWRPSRAAGSDYDSRSTAVRKNREPLEGAQATAASLIEQFDKTKNPFYATEALSAALVTQARADAIHAAEKLAKLDLSSRPALAAQIAQVLADEDAENVRSEQHGSRRDVTRARISTYKRIVGSYPQSALVWLDLALSYTALGQAAQAKRAVLVASSLEPDHRSVARSSSRFHVHNGEFDLAISVIERSRNLKVDPWLISAHIATARASGYSSKLVSAGRKMFKDVNMRPDQISELGAALATNEVENGNISLARKIVARSMLMPTENAVAQIAWLEAVGDVDFGASSSASKLPKAFEARTLEKVEQGDWRGSCVEAAGWLVDQPFSSRPAIHGSYVAATFLEDYELSLKFAEAGYIANPKDVVVMNNYAVGLAETGSIARARSIFDDAVAVAGADWRSILRATDGLISYREGNLERGRAAYREAKNYFRDRGELRNELLATIYQVREECRLDRPIDYLSPLRELIERLNVGDDDPDFSALQKLLLQMSDSPVSGRT